MLAPRSRARGREKSTPQGSKKRKRASSLTKERHTTPKEKKIEKGLRIRARNGAGGGGQSVEYDGGTCKVTRGGSVVHTTERRKKNKGVGVGGGCKK